MVITRCGCPVVIQNVNHLWRPWSFQFVRTTVMVMPRLIRFTRPKPNQHTQSHSLIIVLSFSTIHSHHDRGQPRLGSDCAMRAVWFGGRLSAITNGRFRKTQLTYFLLIIFSLTYEIWQLFSTNYPCLASTMAIMVKTYVNCLWRWNFTCVLTVLRSSRNVLYETRQLKWQKWP